MNRPPAARVPFFELGAYHERLLPLAAEVFDRVFRSGRYILASEVTAFEREAADCVGVAHAIGVSNGTDALVCALMALGIGEGARVVTTPLSFFATVSAVLRVGAVPQFCDVDPETLNWSAASLRAVPRPLDAAIAVHLFGRAAPIVELQRELGEVPLIEDAAQAWGARSSGQCVGSLGALGCFSFFPTKPLGAVGDAGLVTTGDAALAERCRRVRSHGAVEKYLHAQPYGGNYRLDELQAGLLRLKLQDCDARGQLRRKIAQFYATELADIHELTLPAQSSDSEHVWSVYSLQVHDRRDALARFLSARGVETSVYYPTPLHLQPALAHLGYASGDFPVAERACREALALPIYPELGSEQLEWVVGSVRAFFGR